ncbi:unnamed protein product [Cladocopium goreaui]|uniref:NADH-cytochrome b5 reductase 1 n=1 Tax=Cladocopium goreaui TaxID=2562237 RepID=A0A9P1FY78_9DINO|nr:unnamed protein product [Cladocopium goreaui]
MDGNDAMKLILPIAGFAVGVSLLLYFWPRPPKVFLTRERKRAQVADVYELSHDTKRIRLSLGSPTTTLGLPVGKHLAIYAPNPAKCISSGLWNGKPDPDKGKEEIERKYTPVTGNEQPGYVDLVIKIYKPGKVTMPDGKETHWEDGGKMGLFLDSKQPGDWIDVIGWSFCGRCVFFGSHMGLGDEAMKLGVRYFQINPHVSWKFIGGFSSPL